MKLGLPKFIIIAISTDNLYSLIYFILKLILEMEYLKRICSIFKQNYYTSTRTSIMFWFI